MTTTRILEVAIDIAVNAGNLIARNQIHVEDSREMVQFITAKAEQFLRASNYDHDDYIAEVDAFAERELREHYPNITGSRP